MKPCLNSPLELEILMHCYVTCSPIPYADNKVRREAISMLHHYGLIDRSDCLANTTPKGEFYIKALLKTPFPETTFFIPKEDNCEPSN
jgi:hypothetical protein